MEIGYLHRGFEKMSETVDYNGVIPIRLAQLRLAAHQQHGLLHGRREALGPGTGALPLHPGDHVGDLPITDHLTCVGASAMELGAFTVFLYMIKAREFLWELVEMVTGARLTVSYCRVGGVKGDLPDGFPEQCGKALQETRKVLAESDALLTRNRIFVDRSGVGKISAEDAISHGITGPFLRERSRLRRAQGLSLFRLRSTPVRRADWASTGTTSIAFWSAWKRCDSPYGSSSRPCVTSLQARF